MDLMKKRNFSDNLIDYLKLMLNGQPLGPGKSFFLVDSTSNYYTRLRDMGVASNRIAASLLEGEAMLTSAQGDNLLVMPASHNYTASVTWDVADSNIIGLMPHRATYHAAGQPRLVATTAAQAQILNITAANVSMFNIGTYNAAADVGNLYDIVLGANNFYAQGCHFRGGNNTTQTTASGTAPAGVPITLAANGAAGNGAYFKDCTIGSSGNANRTKGPGCLFVPASSGGFGLTFEGCTFAMASKAATGSNLSMVFIAGNYSIPRELLFKNCFLYNYAPTVAENLDVVVQDDCTTDHSIIFMNCAFLGVDALGSNTNFIWNASGPTQVAKGGVAVKGSIS